MLTGFKMSLASRFVLYRPEQKVNGDAWNEVLKFLECKDEINQQIELRIDEKKGDLNV